MTQELKEYICYADGSCIDNGKPNSRGGWAYVVLEKCHKQIYFEHSGEESPTTNNRMELKAVIESLKHFSETRVRIDIHTDSLYVINGFQKKWIEKWIENDFKNASGGEIKNRDLWEELYHLVLLNEVSWTWVKGHSGVEFNEYVDKMAFRESSKNVIKKSKKPSRRSAQKKERKILIHRK